jgi:CBS-domain-containing membrane protein
VLGAVPVDHLMSADPVTVPASLTVERLVHDYVLGRHHSAFPVIDDRGAVMGLVTLDQVRGVPPERRNEVTVAQIALPLDRVPVVEPTESGVEALQRITAARTGRALVVDADHQLVGIVSNADLARALEIGSVRVAATTAPPPPPVPPSRR